MKVKTRSNGDMLSTASEEKITTSTGSKRKASSSLVTQASTANNVKTNMSKRLRTSPLAASPHHSLSASPPSQSTANLSSLPPTSKTPLTPSKPSLLGNGKLSARKQRIVQDPINVTIYNLRKQALDWNDIAEKTNSSCGLVGTDAELTGPACYSRFFRNGSLVAREKGEEWKREWYLGMKGPVVDAATAGAATAGAATAGAATAGGAGAGAGGAEEADEEDDVGKQVENDELDIVEAEVAKAVEKVRERFWEYVRKMVNAVLPDQDLTAEDVKAIHDRMRDRNT